MTYMATSKHKNPCPGGHEIYNFGRPFLCHHYYIIIYLVCLSDSGDLKNNDYMYLIGLL